MTIGSGALKRILFLSPPFRCSFYSDILPGDLFVSPYSGAYKLVVGVEVGKGSRVLTFIRLHGPFFTYSCAYEHDERLPPDVEIVRAGACRLIGSVWF